MLNKIFVTAIFLLICYSFSYGQPGVSFFGEVSYNSYSMTELKQLQNELLNSIKAENIPAEITESFPAYFGFKIGVLFPVAEYPQSTLSLGGMIRHESTGGRIHYSDYSGELKADQIVKTTGIGAVLNYEIHNISIFNLGLNLSVNYLFSSFSYSLYLRVGEAVQNEKPEFSSASIGIEPAIVPSLVIWQARLGISLSYLIYFPSSLEYDKYSDAFLVNNSGEKVNIDWSGFRIGLAGRVSF